MTFLLSGYIEVQRQFVARPYDQRTSRIYLGTTGPKYLIPTSEVNKAQAWWKARQKRGLQEATQGWRLWLPMIIVLPVIHYGTKEFSDFGGPVLISIFLFLFWLRRQNHARVRHDFERQFPFAMPQPGLAGRNYRMLSVSMPRWFQIGMAVMGTSIAASALANDTFSTLTDGSRGWLSVVNNLLIFTLIFLFGLWGVYATVIHTAFRRRFKRRPTVDDFAANIDWFDGVAPTDPAGKR